MAEVEPEATVDQKQKKPDVTPYDFYFETPLYSVIDNEQFTENILNCEVDAYSAEYDTDTTYDVSSADVAESWHHEYNNMRRVTLTNKRKDDDILIFFVYSNAEFTVKIGQLPSLASLQTAGISKKYRKQLGQKHYTAFTRAVGLAAHGVGAGSLVYLRRIFADLIDETYVKNKSKLELGDEEYKLLRMDERVTVLSEYLPSQLVEMKAVYGILSAGIHNLDEDECLTLFRPLKLSIELILDQHIKSKEEAAREKAVKAEVAKIQQELKTKTFD